MTLWFSKDEFNSRLAQIQAALLQRGLDGLVALQPETITWTTGFYTRAYSSFQVAVIPAQGEPHLLCRDVSAYYVETTYAFSRSSFWSDGHDMREAALDVIARTLGKKARIGIEADAWPLNINLHQFLAGGLKCAEWVNVGDITSRLRLIKSPAEIDYQREAAAAAEAGMTAGVGAAMAGNSERDVAAAVCAALVKAGSDTPGPGVLSSGERANHLHGGPTDRHLAHGDTLQLEPTPHVRHYNARFMRTIKIGAASDRDREIADLLIELQDNALAAVAPGVAATVPDRLYREAILGSGLVRSYTNKTFYSIGLMLSPTGAEPLEVTPESDWCFEVGMTFHSYLLVAGFGFSETLVVTLGGFERLTNYPRALIVSG
jgi:Xaa-Pro dipeptidase